jgi:hypothetical protein
MQEQNKTSDLRLSEIDRIIMRLGGDEGARRFLYDQGDARDVVSPILVKSCRTEIGFVRFSVTSFGATGSEWIKKFQEEKIDIDSTTEEMLLSKSFRPTYNKTTNVVVCMGAIFANGKRSAKKVFATAKEYGLVMPDPEVACLMRLMFRKKEDLAELGMRDVVMIMHKPIKVKQQRHGLKLFALQTSSDSNWLYHFSLDGCMNSNGDWSSSVGFAFEEPERSSE